MLFSAVSLCKSGTIFPRLYFPKWWMKIILYLYFGYRFIINTILVMNYMFLVENFNKVLFFALYKEYSWVFWTTVLIVWRKFIQLYSCWVLNLIENARCLVLGNIRMPLNITALSTVCLKWLSKSEKLLNIISKVNFWSILDLKGFYTVILNKDTAVSHS